MSFDANIGRAQPMIKAASNMNNDGGSGGNTEYMMRRRQKKDDKQKSLFVGESDIDILDLKTPKLSESEEQKYGYKNSWFDNIVEKFIK